MKGDELGPDEHIVRYVKPSMVLEDGSPDGSDFQLRPNRPDETGLSVNWLEALGMRKEQQLTEVRRLCRLHRRPKGRFAEMNVGEVRRKVAEELVTLRVIHDPLEPVGAFDADPSHAEITGLPPHGSDQAMLVGDLIAECMAAMHPALAASR